MFPRLDQAMVGRYLLNVVVISEVLESCYIPILDVAHAYLHCAGVMIRYW